MCIRDSCSGVACSPRTTTAGSPGTSSIKIVTSETAVQATSSRISSRLRPPRGLYLRVVRTRASSHSEERINEDGRIIAELSDKLQFVVAIGHSKPRRQTEVYRTTKKRSPGLVRILAQPRQPRAYQTKPGTTYLVAYLKRCNQSEIHCDLLPKCRAAIPPVRFS